MVRSIVIRLIKIYRQRKTGINWQNTKKLTNVHTSTNQKAFPVTAYPCHVTVPNGIGSNSRTIAFSLASVDTWILITWVIQSQLYSAVDLIHSREGCDSHVTHQYTHFIHTRTLAHNQNEKKNHKKVSLVKNIIKVINLYLNRPLRVSPYA